MFVWTVCYSMVMLYVGHKFPYGFFFDRLPQYATFTVGDIFLFIGVIVFVKSLSALKYAYQTGALMVKGVYAYMRHPMYAAWIIFIIPGVAIIGRSLFLLSAAVFAYLLYKRLIEEEERFLEVQFGEAYLEYKKRVGALWPRLCSVSCTKEIRR